jgi:hypothetical protein
MTMQTKEWWFIWYLVPEMMNPKREQDEMLGCTTSE